MYLNKLSVGHPAATIRSLYPSRDNDTPTIETTHVNRQSLCCVPNNARGINDGFAARQNAFQACTRRKRAGLNNRPGVPARTGIADPKLFSGVADLEHDHGAGIIGNELRLAYT